MSAVKAIGFWCVLILLSTVMAKGVVVAHYVQDHTHSEGGHITVVKVTTKGKPEDIVIIADMAWSNDAVATIEKDELKNVARIAIAFALGEIVDRYNSDGILVTSTIQAAQVASQETIARLIDDDMDKWIEEH